MVTIIDIAKQAKVSKSTVSLVINNSPLVRPTSRQRVEQAIKELGYRPNLAARRLKGGASWTIGIIVPNIENPFFSELLLGVESIMDEAGYSCFIASSQDDSEKEKLLLERMMARGCDAFIAVPSCTDGKYYNSLPEQNYPPMTLVSRCPKGCRLDAILPDNYNGSYELGKHIAALRRPVAAISSFLPGNTTTSSRLNGLRKSLSENGINLNPEWLFPVNELTRAEGLRISGEIRLLWKREKRPLSLFAQNDMLAMGVIQGLVAAGVSIPGDVAVFGFDGLDFLRMGILDISSIRISALEIGVNAAKLTLQRLKGKSDPPQKIYVPFQYLPGQTG